MRRIIAWFVGNSVAANLLMLVMVAGGLLALPRIPKKVFPDIDLQIIEVEIVYRGASPEEVEQSLCVPVEEEIESVVGIETLRSIAVEGRCSVYAELYYGTDPDPVLAEVKNRVDGITTFPQEIETPIVSKLDVEREVVGVALSGQVDEYTLKRIARRVRDDLVALPEVSRVELFFDRPYEISIEVPEESLRRHGLSFDQVVQAVRRSSLDLPGGTIKADEGEILLRSIGRAYRGSDFEKIVVITRADGTRLTLGQIARVVDGFEDSDLFARFDGLPAMMVSARRVGGEDALRVSDAVKRYVAEAQERLPAGVELTVWKDSSIPLRGRINTLLRNGRSGLLLVFAVLALFLRFRLALWVSAGVPIALLGALATVPVFGVSIDQVSLFAFILVLGIVVDDAIVVGENVHTHERRHGDRPRAAVEGTQEVAVPVIFGVLTTVAAFVPLLVIPGSMGQLFFYIGLAVIACLTYSLIESQLVLPSHLSHGRSKLGPRERRAPSRSVWSYWDSFQDRFARGLGRFVEQRYRPFLRRAMVWRYLAVSIGMAMLILTLGALSGGWLRFSFFPTVEADYVAAQLVMPRGTRPEATLAALERIRSAADELARRLDPEFAPPGGSLVLHQLVSVGRHIFIAHNSAGNEFGGHVGEVVLELTPSEERSIGTRAIAQRWRELVGEIPEATQLEYADEIFSTGAPIDLQLRGDRGVPLAEAAQAIRERLATYPGVSDIADTVRRGKREIQLELLPEAEPLGVSMEDLARQVRQAFYGEEAQRIQRDRYDVRVMVRYPDSERRSLANLENMRIRTREGVEVPFAAVARASYGRGFADILRTDAKRVVNVTAKVDTALITSNEVLADLGRETLPEILAAYPGLSVALEGEQQDQDKAISGLKRAYVGALLAIYALLAVPLRSYLQPLIIMSVIPFGIVGAVIGHLIMGRPLLSFPSVMGFVALSGVVVNASLVLVDYVNRRRAEGVGLRQAVELAAAARFRPIVLTAVTTFAGLTPLMLEQSLQAQVLIPMAISLAYGVLFATAITLVLVPCAYLILEDISALWRSRQRRPPARVVEVPRRAAPGG